MRHMGVLWYTFPVKAPLLPAVLPSEPGRSLTRITIDPWAFAKKAFLEDLSPQTRRQYICSLKLFASWFCQWLRENHLRKGPAFPWDEAVRMLAEGGHGKANLVGLQWKTSLMKGKSPSTVNARLTALKSYLKKIRVFGLMAWYLEVDPMRAETYRDTRGPGTEAFVKALALLDGMRDPKSVRDRTILWMIRALALRRFEVASLDLEHVDWEKSRIWIKAKMRNSRLAQDVSEETMGRLRQWVAIRGRAPGPLFTNFDRTGKGGNRLSEGGIYRVVKGTGLGKTHGIRHTAITEALTVTNGNIAEVMKFSRHRDPKTVMIYDDNRKNISRVISEKISALGKT